MRQPFLIMENIDAYIKGCRAIGLQDTQVFMTVDLYEAQNMTQVVANIHALARHAARALGFKGPAIRSSLPARQSLDDVVAERPLRPNEDRGAPRRE